jgi:hypothetical protein
MLVVSYGIFVASLLPQTRHRTEMLEVTMRHYNHLGFSILVASGLVALGAAQSTADTTYTYTYTGNPFTFAVSPYTTNDFISGSFDLATPLDNNLPLTDITPLSFSFSDGVQTYLSTDPRLVGSFPSIQTDASGTPSFWFFNATLLLGSGALLTLTTANVLVPIPSDSVSTIPPGGVPQIDSPTHQTLTPQAPGPSSPAPSSVQVCLGFWPLALVFSLGGDGVRKSPELPAAQPHTSFAAASDCRTIVIL